MLTATEYVSTHLDRLEDYVNGVLDGSIVAGDLQKKAVQRFVKSKEKFPYNEQELKRLLKFIYLLNIPLDNIIQRVQLIGWQVFVIANLYCLYNDQEYRTRVYSQAHIEIGKKQGKTTLCAILTLIDSLIDGELNASALLVACSKDQARIALDITKGIIENSPAIKPLFEINKNIIYNTNRTNRIEVKASEAKLVNGSGVSLSIVDEYGDAPDSELKNNIKTGQVARTNPLQITITTASNNKQSPAFTLRETCVNILDEKIDNDSIFCLIFCLDSVEEISNPDMWVKSCPSIGHTVQLNTLIGNYEEAKLIPSSLNSFIVYNLNMWSDNLTKVWIEDEVIKNLMKNTTAIADGSEVYIGIDTSANSDLYSVAVLAYNKATDTFTTDVINIFPSNDKRRIRAGSIDLGVWIEQQFIVQSQLPVIDEDYLYDLIVGLSNKYNVRTIGVDPWNSKALANRLHQKVKTDVNEVRQNIQTLSYPLKVMEKYIMLGRFNLPKSPVVRWMFQNVKIYSDQNGNIKINKQGNEAVDGVVALNICIEQFLEYNQDAFENYK